MVQTRTQRLFRTCFVSGPAGEATAAIAKMIEGYGIEVLSLNALYADHNPFDDILNYISSVDFVVFLLTEHGFENTIFEIGFARGMNKPILLFTTCDRIPFNLLRFNYRKLDTLDQLGDIAADIGRFLRNAKSPSPLNVELPLAPKKDLAWARDELQALRASDQPHQFQQFENLIGHVFEAAGADVQQAKHEQDGGVDFVVWLNDIAYVLGGPILVECKSARGRSGSITRNAKFYVDQLSMLIDKIDANLALLVFDNLPPSAPSKLFAAPGVITITATELIDGLEAGTFERDVILRRRRAAFVGGTGA